MANTNIILTKGGLKTNIADAVLQDRELALAYNTAKDKVELWVGNGLNDGKGKVLLNPDVVVPTKVSELDNDSKFQTEDEVAATVATAIAQSGHASFEVAETIPTADEAKENVLYLVMNSDTRHYDIYAKVGDSVVLLDDTTVDLSAYATTQYVNDELAKKVDKVEGKGLSKNDLTDELKSSYDGAAIHAGQAHAPANAEENVIESVKVNGAAQSVTDKSVNITVPTSADDIGLGNVDNTADADKPVSGPQQAALDGKMDNGVTIDGGTF